MGRVSNCSLPLEGEPAVRGATAVEREEGKLLAPCAPCPPCRATAVRSRRQEFHLFRRMEREYTKMANAGKANAQTMKMLIRERGLPEPPIGASPGEMRLWLKKHGLDGESAPAPPAPISRPRAPSAKPPPQKTAGRRGGRVGRSGSVEAALHIAQQQQQPQHYYRDEASSALNQGDALDDLQQQVANQQKKAPPGAYGGGAQPPLNPAFNAGMGALGGGAGLAAPAADPAAYARAFQQQQQAYQLEVMRQQQQWQQQWQARQMQQQLPQPPPQQPAAFGLPQAQPGYNWLQQAQHYYAQPQAWYGANQ